MRALARISPLARWAASIALLLLLAGCQLTGQVEGAEMDAPASPSPVADARTPAVLEPVGATAQPSPTRAAPEATAVTPTSAPERAASVPSPTSPPATPTAPATPSPVPAPRLFQLTEGGCCTQPFWSPDSSQVLFIDRPAGGPVGVWGVPIEEPGAPPSLATERIAAYSPDGAFIIEGGERTVIEQLADGSRWEIETEGDTPAISPSGERIAWDERDRSLPGAEQVAEIWTAAIDGSGAEKLLDLPRGSVQAWLSDDLLLLNGRGALDDPVQHLFTYSISSGAITDLVSSDRLRAVSLSPGRSWLAYLIAQSSDESQNGLWLARSDGSERRQLPDGFFGAYQWRDNDRLLVVPFQLDAPFHEVWEVDAASGEMRQLVSQEDFSFKIANGDWRVSPDGRYIVFVESRDDNLWAIALP